MRNNLQLLVKPHEERKDIEALQRIESVVRAKPTFQDNYDPINFLGFGIVSYFNLLKLCMFTFIVISLLHLPAISFYKDYSNFDEDV